MVIDGKLAVVGTSTWGLMVAPLGEALRAYGLTYEIDVYGFDREPRLWAGQDEMFEHVPPRGVFVLPDSRVLFRECLDNPRGPSKPVEQARDAALILVESIEAISNRHPQVSWVLCTVEGLHPGPGDAIADPSLDPFSAGVAEFNRQISESTRTRRGWSLFDRSRLTLRWGYHNLHDPRIELLGRFPGSREGMLLLTERLAAHWAAVCGKTKKVLCLDCDNTLWGGIVGEDGVDGIRISEDGPGRAYAEFQRALLAVESRGTLLALCSRNNPHDVEDVFAQRREMVLPRSRIAAMEIGWGSKSDGLRHLADQLGLGLGDFVFIDDDPAEREEVRRGVPEVVVPEFPSDIADLPAFGYDLGWRYFYRIALSAEDYAKTNQYRARAEFARQRKSVPNPREFLRSLNMKATIAVNPAGLVARCAQLTQKTNQFNVTLRRYTEAEIREALADPRCIVFVAGLEDRFGQHGWVGLAIFRRVDECGWWSLDAFLMSCRVLGRSLEGAFLKACIGRLRLREPLPVCVRFTRGPRNAPAESFVETSGFRLLAEQDDGSRDYCLDGDVADNAIACVDVIWEE